MSAKQLPLTAFASVNPRSTHGTLAPNTQVSFIAMQDVSENGEWKTHQTRKYRDVAAGFTRFSENDVLFAKITPCMENGKGCLARGLTSGAGFGSTEFHVLRANSNADAGFVFRWSQSIALRQAAKNFMTGSAGQQRVQTRFFSQFLVAELSRPEQRRIAEILDTLDEAIRKTEQVIAKLQQMKQGLLHDLLTRGIDENGELRDPLRHPEQFKDSPLGRIPKEWEVGPFERLAASVDPQPDHRTPPHVADGIPYVGVGDFVSDTLLDLARCRRVSESAARKQESRFRLEEGDIIFGKIGTIGRPRLLPMGARIALSANVILVKPRADASFVLTLLDSPYVREYIGLASHTTSQPAFGIQKIRAMHVAIPPADEQLCLGKILRSHGTCMSSEITQLSKLRLLKQGLMDDLLTGRVRVKVTEAAE